MSIFRRAAVAVAEAPAPIQAAATRIDAGDRRQITQIAAIRRSSQEWQREAWEYYDAIGEIKYAFNLMGSLASRVRFFPAAYQEKDDPPVEASDVKDLTPGIALAAGTVFGDLDNTPGGFPELIRNLSINLCVAGEGYLFREWRTDSKWTIRSISELETTGDTVRIRPSARSEAGLIVAQKNAYIGRIWRPHPRFSLDADSSMRGVLDDCDELLLLSRMVKTVARSRLNSGILAIPDTFTTSKGNPEDDDTDLDTNDFEDDLVTAFSTPIQDETHVSSVAPFILRGPSDEIKNIQWFEMKRSVDEELVNRADRVLERIMQGIDIPKDIVSGLTSLKYANAIRLDESLFKSHLEPLMVLICNSLAEVYLKPYLIQKYKFSPEQAKRITVWYDPTDVLVRPDRAADAETGYKEIVLSGAAWRREHGFPETDAPSGAEIALRMLTRQVQPSSELIEKLLRHFAPETLRMIDETAKATTEATLNELGDLAITPDVATEETEPTEQAPADEEIDQAEGMEEDDAGP